MSQNRLQVPIDPGLAMEKKFCVIRRLLTPFLIMVFACAICVTVLHHHEDGEPHPDCALCLLLIQPAVAGNVEDRSASLFLALPENPPAAVISFISLCFRVAVYCRAPPP